MIRLCIIYMYLHKTLSKKNLGRKKSSKMIGRLRKGNDKLAAILADERGSLEDVESHWYKTRAECQAYIAKCYEYACDNNDCSLGYHDFKSLNADHLDECYEHEYSCEEACDSDECYHKLPYSPCESDYYTEDAYECMLRSSVAMSDYDDVMWYVEYLFQARDELRRLKADADYVSWSPVSSTW